MSCEHTTSHYVDKGFYDWDGDWVEDMQWIERTTFVDIDLHRYKCTQCGYVGYYSNLARKFYENGEGDLMS